MSRLMHLVLTPLVALALVLGAATLLQMQILYEVLYVVVAAVGLGLTVFYLSTWGFYASRAWRKGKLRDLSTIAILEFVIIPVMAVPAFSSALYGVWTVGFPVTPAIRFSRMMFGVVLLAVMTLRTLNWVLRWREKRQTREDPEDAVKVPDPF